MLIVVVAVVVAVFYVCKFCFLNVNSMKNMLTISDERKTSIRELTKSSSKSMFNMHMNIEDDTESVGSSSSTDSTQKKKKSNKKKANRKKH